MGFSRRFDIRLAIRLAALVAAVFAFAALLALGGLPATTIIAGLVMVWAAYAIWALVRRTNGELARFVAALGQGDMTQGFAQEGRGSGFDDLGIAFDTAIARLRAARADGATESHFAEALVNGAPTPLLAIDETGRVETANRAARRLFAGGQGVRIDDYARFGADFVGTLQATASGLRSTRLLVDGLPQRAIVGVTRVERGGQPWRIVSIQLIQAELDTAEVAVQADLVRVLTHEIMNSMTPVTSLAESAAGLMARIDRGADPDIADARIAVETLAKRAGGIMHFVESYRAFSRAPAVTITSFGGHEWARHLVQLFAASTLGPRVRLDVSLPTVDPIVSGDVDLLTQVVLNLMKNGAEAASEFADAPSITLAVVALADGRTKIAVSDNGPGIPPKVAQDVFLPFFTTKRTGTGVGLSFARQVVLLHGGAIGIVPTPTGACFEMVI